MIDIEYAMRVIDDCRSIKTAFKEDAKKIYRTIYPHKPYTWFSDVSISKNGDEYYISAYHEKIDWLGHDVYKSFNFPAKWLEMSLEEVKKEYDANNDLAHDDGGSYAG